MGFSRRTFLERTGILIGSLGCAATSPGWGRGWEDRVMAALAAPLGRQFALLVGINAYPERVIVPDNWGSLRGCCTDVQLQRELLVERFGFDPQRVLTLTDGAATWAGLIAAFQEFLGDVQPGDTVVFHFSGYGGRSQILASGFSSVPGIGKLRSPIPDQTPGPVSDGLVLADSVLPQGRDRPLQDLSLETLWLLLRSLPTDRLITVLDTSFVTPLTPWGNLQIRSRPDQITGDRSPQELTLRASLRQRLGQAGRLAGSDRPSPLPSGLLLQAAAPEGLAAEVAWNGQWVGAFTYALTQHLWQMTPATQLRTVLSRSASSVERWVGSRQRPQIQGIGASWQGGAIGNRLGLESAAAVIESSASGSYCGADGVVLRVEPGGKAAQLWLAGLPALVTTDAIEGAVFEIVAATPTAQKAVSAPQTAPPETAQALPASSGSTAPGTTAPGTTAPGTTAPGTTAPGITVQGTTAQGSTSQGSNAPSASSPSASSPLSGVLESGLLGSGIPESLSAATDPVDPLLATAADAISTIATSTIATSTIATSTIATSTIATSKTAGAKIATPAVSASGGFGSGGLGTVASPGNSALASPVTLPPNSTSQGPAAVADSPLATMSPAAADRPSLAETPTDSAGRSPSPQTSPQPSPEVARSRWQIREHGGGELVAHWLPHYRDPWEQGSTPDPNAPETAGISPQRPAIAPGQWVQELLRPIPRHLHLNIAIDPKLERIERVDATSAFAAIPTVSLVPGVDRGPDYWFGRVRPDLAIAQSTDTPLPKLPEGSYGLFSLAEELLPNTIGEGGEAVKTGVQRLALQLRNRLALKFLRLTENPGSSRLPLRVTMELLSPLSSGNTPESPPDPQILFRQATRAMPWGTAANTSVWTRLRAAITKSALPAPSLAPPAESAPFSHGDSPLNWADLTVVEGSRIQYRIDNASASPLSVLLLGFDSNGSPFALYPPEPITVPAYSTLPVPTQADWKLRPGIADLSNSYVICSVSPFTRAYTVLETNRRNQGIAYGIGSWIDPLETVRAILEDLHEASQVAGDESSEVYVLATAIWATFNFEYRVI